jgi:hypothetical protein
MSATKIDSFISYTSADQGWAEWIGWILEEEGFSAKLQAWDFAAGSNFVLEMQRAAEAAARTIAVLSPTYLKSTFAAPEWAAAFAKDPEGFKRSLVPVRVERCEPGGLLKTIVYIDLVDLDEDEARRQLVDRLSGGRSKPSKKPKFPGSAQESKTTRHSPAEGAAQAASQPPRHMPKIHRAPTDLERSRFIKTCFDTVVQHFKEALAELSAQDREHADYFRIFHRERENRRLAGGEGGIWTPEGLSSLPVFEFEGIMSTIVHTKQSRTLVSPPECVFFASVRPLGGQSGGQNSAREMHSVIDTVSLSES